MPSIADGLIMLSSFMAGPGWNNSSLGKPSDEIVALIFSCSPRVTSRLDNNLSPGSRQQQSAMAPLEDWGYVGSSLQFTLRLVCAEPLKWPHQPSTRRVSRYGGMEVFFLQRRLLQVSCCKTCDFCTGWHMKHMSGFQRGDYPSC